MAITNQVYACLGMLTKPEIVPSLHHVSDETLSMFLRAIENIESVVHTIRVNRAKQRILEAEARVEAERM